MGERLIENFGVFPVIVGGPEDRTVGERLIDRWGLGANAAGSLSVRVSAAMMERLTLYIGNDTGSMHLAAAAGLPCVAIFAAVDWPGRWHPIGDGHRVLRRHVECEGCHSPICFNYHKCLDLITVEQVFDACQSVLSSNAVNEIL